MKKKKLLALLIYFCPVFGYLIIPASVLFVLLSAGFRTVLKRRHTDVQEADGELRSFFQESMSALLVVKAFSKEDLMETYAKECMETHKKARVRKNYFSNFCNTGFVVVMNAAYVTGTALGGYGILTGRMSYGTLIAIVQLIGQIQSPLSGLTGYIPQIYSMFASVERLQKIETYNCFLMHGAVISVQGDGYLFTAPSGTGKSTHVSLWKKYIDGVEIINGDKPFLRVTDHGIWAYGTPWAGKEGWQKNERVLLKGICLLMRGKENRVSMLVQEQVLPFLIRQIYYTDNPEMAGKTLELLDQVMKQIYFYEVSCNVSKEAALCCYDGLCSRFIDQKKSLFHGLDGMSLEMHE